MTTQKKYFSKSIDKYFIRWIDIDTWYTMDDFDINRFYRFIHALSRFARRSYSNRDIQNRIEDAVISKNKHFDREFLKDKARELSIIAIHCLGCLKVRINPYYDFKK